MVKARRKAKKSGLRVDGLLYEQKCDNFVRRTGKRGEVSKEELLKKGRRIPWQRR